MIAFDLAAVAHLALASYAITPAASWPRIIHWLILPFHLAAEYYAHISRHDDSFRHYFRHYATLFSQPFISRHFIRPPLRHYDTRRWLAIS